MEDCSNNPAISIAAQMLAESINAYRRALHAQSAGNGTRHWQMADLAKLQNAIDYWQEKVDAETGQTSNGGVVYASFG